MENRTIVRVSEEIAEQELSIETGLLAEQVRRCRRRSLRRHHGSRLCRRRTRSPTRHGLFPAVGRLRRKNVRRRQNSGWVHQT